MSCKTKSLQSISSGYDIETVWIVFTVKYKILHFGLHIHI